MDGAIIREVKLKTGARKKRLFIFTYAERIIAESFIETCHINHSNEKKYDT